jgi:PAS domain S-box-containing protein
MPKPRVQGFSIRIDGHGAGPSQRPLWSPNTPVQTAILVCLVAVLSYFAPRLAGALILHPQTIWPLWPGCALLVPVLLLVPRRIWLAVTVAAFAGFVVYDLQSGVPLRSIAWFIPADLLEILIATLCLSHYFGGIPRLNSAKALTIFLVFAVILAPFTAAFVSARGVASDYWTGWKVCFFSEVLAFLTLTPAVFSWISDGRAWLRKSPIFHLEAAALLTGLAFLSHIAFTASATASSPALLYALVPFLLWSALRFGSIGTSSAVILVALLSIWGAVHGRGPFIEQGPFHSVRSIQLFLISTAIPFMVLAALAEERRDAEEALKRQEEELIEAQRVSQVGSWQWNPKTDEVAWSKELYRLAGRDPDLPPPALGEQTKLYTSESWERLKCAVAEALRNGTTYTLDLEMLRPDGRTRWIIDRGEAVRDAAGRIAWLRGTAQDITERKQAEDQLRASEEKFRRVFRDAGVGMVIVSPDGRFLAANEAFCECLGYTEEELLQKTVQSITLPEDWPAFSKRLREALQRGTSFQRAEKRCLHKCGRIVTTESSASLIRGPSGEPQYFVGEVLDITQRKLAEEALSGLSGRLIEAQEEERAWIARELHDDFNQRVALLAFVLESVKQDFPATEGAARRRIEDACQSARELGTDIQALSHRLHSSRLEYLGLAAAAAGFCQELATRQNVEIDFRSENIPNCLPKETSLCLFRVLQEALQNALKHSGERRFDASLKCVVNEIELTVHDSGVGFDPEKAMSGQGLGFTSMKERLKLVDGQLSVASTPQRGTTIHARVPLKSLAKSASSVG